MHFAALIFMVGAGGLASVLEVGVAEQTKAQQILEEDGDEPAPNTPLNSLNRDYTFAAHA
tara:strand:- start:3863 stop:4042 length:180 start_codon:yes stop_codon:yes gene_type:complete